MTQVNRPTQLQAVSFRGSATASARPMALSPSGDVAALESQFADIAKTQRKRIWDLPGHYHCSIVGTCLSTAELKKLLSTLGMAAPAESEHDLHGLGVGLASRQDMAGKLLNKALDDRHLLTLKRYARARTLEALQALWREDVKSGDIPGGYWAVLTHPACAHALAREAFGYVHMLSHLVGAANRADIRRLQQLEAQNALLAETIERQQVKLRDIAVECRATVQQWQRDLAGREMADESPAVDAQASLRSMIADLRRQLDSETNRRTIAEARLSRAQAEISEARVAATQAQNLAKTLQSEIDAVERGLASRQAEGLEDTPEPAIDLGGMTVLYVGGRPTQLPHLRQAAAARGAAFLHHDGGIEDNGLMLAGLVNRADLVLFPVDCVSHAAVGTVKRACRNAGKTYLPLRSAAVTSFIAALGGQP